MANVKIISVPRDRGAGRRGCDMGPSALRLAGLKERLIGLGYDVSDVDVPVGSREALIPAQANAKFLPEILRVCEATATEVATAVLAEQHPIVLGGDHSVAIGSIAGLAKAYRQLGKRFGVIWVDAHADMNTPDSSPSGNVHGMPLAVNLGNGAPELCAVAGNFAKLDPDHVALVGIRDLDKKEKALVRQSGVHAYTMSDIDRIRMAAVMDEILAHMRGRVDVLHVSFDLDGLDPSLAPGVGTPVGGGLNYREAHLMMEMVAESGMLGSMDIVEDNPVLDVRNQTAKVAVELVTSGFGKRIL